MQSLIERLALQKPPLSIAALFRQVNSLRTGQKRKSARLQPCLRYPAVSCLKTWVQATGLKGEIPAAATPSMAGTDPKWTFRRVMLTTEVNRAGM
jgi:hypothetical protein